MSIRRSNQLSYNPKKRKVNKGRRPPSGKPSMHVTKIGGRTVLQAPGDDLAQALGRKRVIRQPSQREPFETDLPAIALPALPDGRKILAMAVEDRFDLMKMAMDSMHGVVLADVFAEIKETLRHDLESEFLEDLSTHGVAKRLAVILAATREHEKLALFRADTHRQDVVAAQDDGTCGRPNPGGCTTGLATWSGHEGTLPGPARQ